LKDEIKTKQEELEKVNSKNKGSGLTFGRKKSSFRISEDADEGYSEDGFDELKGKVKQMMVSTRNCFRKRIN